MAVNAPLCCNACAAPMNVCGAALMTQCAHLFCEDCAKQGAFRDACPVCRVASPNAFPLDFHAGLDSRTTTVLRTIAITKPQAVATLLAQTNHFRSVQLALQVRILTQQLAEANERNGVLEGEVGNLGADLKGVRSMLTQTEAAFHECKADLRRLSKQLPPGGMTAMRRKPRSGTGTGAAGLESDHHGQRQQQSHHAQQCRLPPPPLLTLEFPNPNQQHKHEQAMHQQHQQHQQRQQHQQPQQQRATTEAAASPRSTPQLASSSSLARSSAPDSSKFASMYDPSRESRGSELRGTSRGRTPAPHHRRNLGETPKPQQQHRNTSAYFGGSRGSSHSGSFATPGRQQAFDTGSKRFRAATPGSGRRQVMSRSFSAGVRRTPGSGSFRGRHGFSSDKLTFRNESSKRPRLP